MSTESHPGPHQVLDATHGEMLLRLDELTTLARRLADSGIDPAMQTAARRIEAFFSGQAREHHALEERSVFPALMVTATPALAATLRSLTQDHGWIEENWIALSPQLTALADGLGGLDLDEFAHVVEVFLDLCRRHIAVEEALVYPASRAAWAQGRAG
jgi:hemerythrin-like domain-containing protein